MSVLSNAPAQRARHGAQRKRRFHSVRLKPVVRHRLSHALFKQVRRERMPLRMTARRFDHPSFERGLPSSPFA
jgi:hypothetical protein